MSGQNEIEAIENIKAHNWVSQNGNMQKLNMDTWIELVSTPSSFHCCIEINRVTILGKLQSHVMETNLQFQKRALGERTKKLTAPPVFYELWVPDWGNRRPGKQKDGEGERRKTDDVLLSGECPGPHINRLQAHPQTICIFFWIIRNG